jgi:aminomethyltransferase
MVTELNRTPLNAVHRALNGRMVDYAGWDLPVMYAGILEEARAVRNDIGIFDISHMGRVRIYGEGATDLLQSLTSNDVAALRPSGAHYSLLTNQTGGIIDDIIVYREDVESYLVVINAGNAAKDLAWIRSKVPNGVTVDDQTAMTAMIAVQGPNAPGCVADLAQRPALLELSRFQYATATLAGVPATLCRTGYTGEDGFEVIVPAAQAPVVWQALMEAGALPCGLGARDALRIEAGYPLYGHEIDETTSPVEAGLMWVVKLDKGEYYGRDVIAEVKRVGAQRKLMGLISDERIQPRQGYTILVDGEAVGAITSGVFSPTLGRSLAMGYLSTPFAQTGRRVEIAIRDKRSPATVVQKKSLLGDRSTP